MVGSYAGVAQLVEQRIRNAKVGSSTLLTGTTGSGVSGVAVANPLVFLELRMGLCSHRVAGLPRNRTTVRIADGTAWLLVQTPARTFH